MYGQLMTNDWLASSIVFEATHCSYAHCKLLRDNLVTSRLNLLRSTMIQTTLELHRILVLERTPSNCNWVNQAHLNQPWSFYSV